MVARMHRGGISTRAFPRCQTWSTAPSPIHDSAVLTPICVEVNVKQAVKSKAKWFAVSVSLIGCVGLFYSIYRLHLNPVRLDWLLVLAVTMLLCWRAEVWIPGVRSKITLTDVFVCIAILMLGPWAAAALASIEGLARSARGNTRSVAATALVNMGAMNIAVLSASLLHL